MRNLAHTDFSIIKTRFCFVFLAAALASCTAPLPGDDSGQSVKYQVKIVPNPVFHFEIPVTDMGRAIRFYWAVFGYKLKLEKVDGYEMAFFPRSIGAPGASGALAKGDVYIPSKTGPILYFNVADIDPVLQSAEAYGGKILYPKKHIGAAGYVGEIEDSEGNRIGLTAVSD